MTNTFSRRPARRSALPLDPVLSFPQRVPAGPVVFSLLSASAQAMAARCQLVNGSSSAVPD